MTEAFQHKSAACVIVGAFAPASFHPLWFEHFGLLGKQESTTAAKQDNLLVTDEIALFKVGGFEFDLRPERIQIGTNQENLFSALRDLVASTLNILEATKVTAVGLNWTAHLALGSEAAWHEAGHKMLPFDLWERIWPKQHIGMKNVVVELGRKDDKQGNVQVNMQPSAKLPHGMYIALNDHYELKKDPASYGADAAKLIVENWTSSQGIAEAMFENVRKAATNG